MTGRLAAAFVLFVWLGVGASWCSPTVEARRGQHVRRIEPPMVGYVRQAMIFVSECGFHCRENEMQAIHRSLRNKGGASRIYEHMVNYCTAVFDVGRTDYRAWIPNLRADFERPLHWPVFWIPRGGPARLHPAWNWGKSSKPSFRIRWERVLIAAQRIYGSELNPCDGEPLDWGCQKPGCDDVTAYMARNPEAVVIDCGDTKNVFLRATPEKP